MTQAQVLRHLFICNWLRPSFNSLYKVAHDYRSSDPLTLNSQSVRPVETQSSSHDELAVNVPLQSLLHPHQRLFFFVSLVAAMIVGAAIASAAFYLTNDDRNPAPLAVASIKPAVPVKNTRTSSEGIALPAEILAAENDSAVGEIARQLQSMSVLVGHDGEKSAQNSGIVVTDDEEDTDNRRAAADKAETLERSDNLEKLKNLATDYPEIAAVHAALARLEMRHGDDDAAMASWFKAMEIEPGNDDYRLGLAVLYDRMGQDKNALAQYRQVVAHTPDVQRRMDYLAERQNAQ